MSVNHIIDKIVVSQLYLLVVEVVQNILKNSR